MYYFFGVWLPLSVLVVSAATASDHRTWPHCLREQGQPKAALWDEPRPRFQPHLEPPARPRYPQAPGSSCLGFLTLFLFPEYSLLAPSFLLKSPCPSLKTQVKLFSLHVWQVAPIPGGEGASAPSLGADRCQILFYAELQDGDCHLDTAFSFNSPLSYLLDGSNVLLFSKGLTAW